MTNKLDSLIIPSKPIINKKNPTQSTPPGERHQKNRPWKPRYLTGGRLPKSKFHLKIPIGGKRKGGGRMKGTNMGGADELVELGRRRLVAPPLLGVVVAEAPEPPQRRLHPLRRYD